MFCKKCGSEISASDETCPKCGTFISDKFATEKYDPLLALDNVENVEGDVIWQEAPLDEDSIILNPGDLAKTSEPLIKEPKASVDEFVQNVHKEEKQPKENFTQGIRAAKSTIAHPIKPRKRIKPKESPKTETPKLNINTQNGDVIAEPIEKVEEPVIKEAPVIEEAPVVQEAVVEEVPVVEETPIVQESVVEETPLTDSPVDDAEVVDLFDDFVVDDSIAIIDETPDIIEETPVVEEAPVVEEVPVVEETPIVQEAVVEEVPFVEETTVVGEVPVIDEVIDEPVVDNEFTPEDALFEEVFFEREPEFEPIADVPIETPIMEEVQTKLEEIAKTEEKTESVEKSFVEKPAATGVEVAGAAVAGAASRAKQPVVEKSDNAEDTILKSIDDKKTVEDERDTAIKSKFNTTFGTEDEEDLDLDENINSLTSKITTFLIIFLILIIAVVVATFLVQRIGL